MSAKNVMLFSMFDKVQGTLENEMQMSAPIAFSHDCLVILTPVLSCLIILSVII